MCHRISKANDAAQEEIGGAEPGSYYSGPACLAGMMQIRLGTILFGAFMQGCPQGAARRGTALSDRGKGCCVPLPPLIRGEGVKLL